MGGMQERLSYGTTEITEAAVAGLAGQPSIFSGNLKAKQKNKAESLRSTWSRKCVIPAWLVPLTQQGCSGL